MDVFIWFVGLIVLILVGCGLLLVAAGLFLNAISTTILAVRLWKSYPHDKNGLWDFLGAWWFSWTDPGFAIRFAQDFERQKKL